MEIEFPPVPPIHPCSPATITFTYNIYVCLHMFVCTCTYIINTPYWILFCCLHVYGSKADHSALDSWREGSSLGEANPPSPSNHWLPVGFFVWWVGSCETSPFHINMATDDFCFSGVLYASIPRRSCFGAGLLIFRLLKYVRPSSSVSLSHRLRGCGVGVCPGAGSPMIHWSLPCVQLSFSVMVSVCCEERLLWGVAVIFICGSKDKSQSIIRNCSGLAKWR